MRRLSPIERVVDYNELDSLERIDGTEVLVLYSNLLYRLINGQWVVVGKVVYRR